MLAKDILKSARYMLSDTGMNRWTDERLLSLLNDGLRDIAKTTILFTRNVFLGISNEVVDYDLSSTVIKIHRIEWLGEPLPFYSFEEMDKKYGKGWQSVTGTEPLAIVYNLQNSGCFKIYPIVSNAQNDHMVFSQTYGIITYITYSDIEFLLEDDFGDLGELEETGYLKIFYTRKHPKVTDVNTEIELDDLTLEPLAHYIAGRALRDNTDVQNRTVGNEEINFYMKALEEYSIEKAGSFGQTKYEVPYNQNGV